MKGLREESGEGLGGLNWELSDANGAIAAYVTILLFQQAGVSPLIGALLGITAAVALAVVIGAATLRLTGPYFSLATLAAGRSSFR